MGGIFYIGKYNCGATDGQFKMEEIPKWRVLNCRDHYSME